MKYFIPYLILGIPLVLLLIHFRKGKMGGLQFVTIGGLTLAMAIYSLFQLGIVGQYVIKVGDKEFYVSPSAFDKMITENLDRFAGALSKIYSQCYQVEAFDVSRSNDRVAYTNDNRGRFAVRLKLQHRPMPNTIQVLVSDGEMRFNADDPLVTVDSNNWIQVPFFMSDDAAKALITKTPPLQFGVTYLREIE